MNANIQVQIDSIINQIVSKYLPSKVILFGSQSDEEPADKGDIDLCIVKNTDNKRRLLSEIYHNIESDLPVDILLYTESEWNECVNDRSTFVHLISKRGVPVYG